MGPPYSPEFKELDRERAEGQMVRKVLAGIRREIRDFNKDNGITCDVDDEGRTLVFTIQEGDVNVLRMRFANIVGRHNEALSGQQGNIRLSYDEHIPDTISIGVVETQENP
jgi:hypothetical protein